MDAAASIPSPRSHRPNGAGQEGAKSFLIGSGIASLAAAAFMVRDGGVPGESIAILEGLGTVGGSLDGGGSVTQAAVHGLPGLPHGPPAVCQGRFDPHALLRAFRALHDVRA